VGVDFAVLDSRLFGSSSNAAQFSSKHSAWIKLV
jgi:hypothetical protein